MGTGQCRKFKVVLVLTVLLGAVCADAEWKPKQTLESALDKRQHIPAIYGDLRESLGAVAEAYRLPLVAVLAGASPRIELPAGVLTPRQVLNLLVKANPDYNWEVRDSVVFFYHSRVREDPKNMLNWRIKQFTISDTVADLELRLRANLNKIWKGIKAEGGVIVGMRSTELAKHPLPKTVLHNVTGEQVLLKVTSLDRGFYSILVYPTPRPITDQDIYAAFASWRWVPFETRK